MKAELIEFTEQVATGKTREMFKIRLGSFVKFSDTPRNRRASIQFYNVEKTDDPVPPIPYVLDDVPLLYFGNNRAQTDFDLLVGDELLVMFSDVSTDTWRNPGGNIPALEEREDRHSIDYAVAFPIVSFHNVLTQSVLNHYQIKLQAGQKLQIGIESGPGVFSVELVQELYTVFNAMSTLSAADGDSLATAFATFQSGPLASLLTKLQTIGTVV